MAKHAADRSNTSTGPWFEKPRAKKLYDKRDRADDHIGDRFTEAWLFEDERAVVTKDSQGDVYILEYGSDREMRDDWAQRGRSLAANGHGPRMNPVASGLLIGAGVAVVAALGIGGGYLIRKQILKKKAIGQLPPAPEDQALQGIWAPGGTALGARADVAAEIAQPIYLAKNPGQGTHYIVVPIPLELDFPDGTGVVQSTSSGAPLVVDKVIFGVTFDGADDPGTLTAQNTDGYQVFDKIEPQAIAALVLPLSPDAIKAAYEWSIEDLSNHPTFNWDADHDVAIKRILSYMAPGVDWSRGLEPFVYNSPASQVWYGVQTMLAIVYQSRLNAHGGA